MGEVRSLADARSRRDYLRDPLRYDTVEEADAEAHEWPGPAVWDTEREYSLDGGLLFVLEDLGAVEHALLEMALDGANAL